jgi:AcrR family transcriptional regulator
MAESSSGLPNPSPSLWDDHKARTRRAPSRSGTEPLRRTGIRSTTVDQIATRARVSKRTFFRYFPTKEAALFWARRQWVRLLAETNASQPASIGEVDALAATFIDLAARLPRDRLLLYTEVMASSPTLRSPSPEKLQEELIKLAEAIAVRRSLPHPDDDCVLIAFVEWVTHKRAHDRWAELPDADLIEVVIDEFDRLVHLFSR